MKSPIHMLALASSVALALALGGCASNPAVAVGSAATHSATVAASSYGTAPFHSDMSAGYRPAPVPGGDDGRALANNAGPARGPRIEGVGGRNR